MTNLHICKSGRSAIIGPLSIPEKESRPRSYPEAPQPPERSGPPVLQQKNRGCTRNLKSTAPIPVPRSALRRSRPIFLHRPLPIGRTLILRWRSSRRRSKRKPCRWWGEVRRQNDHQPHAQGPCRTPVQSKIKADGKALSCACGARLAGLPDARCPRWCTRGQAEWKLSARRPVEGNN